MPKDKQTTNEPGKDELKKKVVVVEEVEEETSVDNSQPIVKNETVEEKEDVKTEIEVKSIEPKAEENISVIDNQDDESNDKPNYLWIIVPTALLVGALVGGLITYFSGISNMNSGVTQATATPIATPESTDNVVTQATATPSSTLRRETIKVQVLNGSGISGLAGKVKTMLESLGYKNVTAGNASSSNSGQTEIAIKDDKKEYLDVIIKDLSKEYEAVESKKPLTASSSYDIVITLGSK